MLCFVFVLPLQNPVIPLIYSHAVYRLVYWIYHHYYKLTRGLSYQLCGADKSSVPECLNMVVKKTWIIYTHNL